VSYFRTLTDSIRTDEYQSVADDLPPGVRTLQGNLGEMAANFEGWDPA
jgi:hypothetical protein